MGDAEAEEEVTTLSLAFYAALADTVNGQKVGRRFTNLNKSAVAL